MQHKCNGEVVRTQAHAALRRNDAAGAERAFTRLLETSPADVEALQFLAQRQLACGNAARGIELLVAAGKMRSDDGAVWHQLGVAQLGTGDFAAAAVSLRKGLDLIPDDFEARLWLGRALEQQGRSREALVAYFAAIKGAQGQRLWRNDASTRPALREPVKHAMHYVDAGRKKLFDAVLEPLRERHGGAALERVAHCLDIYLHQQPARCPDPRQRPTFLYFPDIPSRAFYAQHRFPANRNLEASVEAVREELLGVLGGAQGALEPFLGQSGNVSGLLESTGRDDAAWDAFFFYRHGQRHEEHCRQCPRTAALLDTDPLVRVRDHGPEIFFSVLRPGTRIMPHRGVTNTRLVTHLPLIVPPDCALKVGGQTHAWKEGHCVTFDDTFEHEAWNRSERTRVVLIVDRWNPDLTEVEREAVSELVAAIGDFNRGAEPAAAGR